MHFNISHELLVPTYAVNFNPEQDTHSYVCHCLYSIKSFLEKLFSSLSCLTEIDEYNNKENA